MPDRDQCPECGCLLVMCECLDALLADETDRLIDAEREAA